MAQRLGIDVHSCHGHTLFEPHKVIAKNGGISNELAKRPTYLSNMLSATCKSAGQPPLTYQSFVKLIEGPSFQPIPEPLEVPSEIPPPSAARGKLADESTLPTLKELGYEQEASLKCK